MSDKKNQALYSVIFSDETDFKGGDDYFNTKWLDIPDKKIKRIFYRLPGGDYLALAGYEKYYHMIEGLKDWARVSKRTGKIKKTNGKTQLQYAYIIGKIQDKVVSYRITLFNNSNDRYRIGDITKRIYNVSDENIKGLNPDGWK